MKKIAFLLMLLFPLANIAQDDIYYVPKKAKKVLVVKSSDESYFVDADEEVDEVYEEVDEGYYIDNPDYLYDDYSYSKRIIRFRSPKRLVASSIYWDLMYDCGVRDWYVYDNGYSIDIYPTVVNPLFYWPAYTFSAINYWTWNDYYNWSWRSHWYDYHWYDYHWHHNHWYYGHNHWYHHNHHYHGPTHAYHRSWKPIHRPIPTNGSIGRGSRGGRSGDYA